MLTFLAIERAKKRAKPYKLSDGEGLHLLVEPTGSKLWRFRYQFDHKEKIFRVVPRSLDRRSTFKKRRRSETSCRGQRPLSIALYQRVRESLRPSGRPSPKF
jgi:hypothetical protein